MTIKDDKFDIGDLSSLSYAELEDLLDDLSYEELENLTEILDSVDSFSYRDDDFAELVGYYYTKKEIIDQCKKYNISGYSGLNKDDLLEHFILELLTPEYIQGEIERMTDIQKLMLVVGVQVSAIDEHLTVSSSIEVPETFLMFKKQIFLGVDDYYELVIPNECLPELETFIENHSELNQLYEAYRLLIGSVNLYGVLTFKQLQNIYNTYLDMSMKLIEVSRWLKNIELVNSEAKNYEVENGLIINTVLADDESEVSNFVKDAKYYMPETKEEFFNYEELPFGIERQAFNLIVDWLDVHANEDSVEMISPQQLAFDTLLMMKQLPDFEFMEEAIEHAVDKNMFKKSAKKSTKKKFEQAYYMIRNWYYNGHTVKEFQELLKNKDFEAKNVIDFYQYQQNEKK